MFVPAAPGAAGPAPADHGPLAARGGPRPGAGRPKGSGSKAKKASAAKAETKKTKPKGGKVTVMPPGPPPEEDVLVGEVLPANMNPLEYMLHVMNNRKAEPDRRDQ